MRLGRFIAFIFILVLGGVLIFVLKRKEFSKGLDPSLAPAFQVAGRYTQSVDRLIGKVVPVNSLDEKELGEVIIHSFKQYKYVRVDSDPVVLYLNKAFSEVKKFGRKPFDYQIHLTNVPSPNAFALPGGHIVVHIGLLDSMKSEAEVISMLAHELGHIEMEHCFQAVKFELLSKKITGTSLGKIADFANALLLRHSFSKTQENEADEYALTLLKSSSYDPSALGNAFRSLKKALESQAYQDQKRHNVDFLRDYFMSHPPLDLRISEFSEAAKAWWLMQPAGTKRYVGTQNLKQSISFTDKKFDDEWIGY